MNKQNEAMAGERHLHRFHRHASAAQDKQTTRRSFGTYITPTSSVKLVADKVG